MGETRISELCDFIDVAIVRYGDRRGTMWLCRVCGNTADDRHGIQHGPDCPVGHAVQTVQRARGGE